MARLTFEWHFAQTPSPPKKTSRRRSCKTRRGHVRMPNAVLSVAVYRRTQYQLRASSSSDWEKNGSNAIICSVESCWNHCESERAARTREKEGCCQREVCVERVRLFAKKPIVVRRWPEGWTRWRRVSGSSWKRTDLRDRPASYKNKTKESSLQSSSATQVSVKL